GTQRTTPECPGDIGRSALRHVARPASQWDGMTILGEARIKPVRVAIIDDSEDVRAMLRFQFSQDERFSVVGEGGDGHEAIAVAERMRPDLMILDQMMPELTGLEAIPKIRRMSPETAIILYTAQDARGDYQAAL